MSAQDKVREFHVATHGTIGETPAIRDGELRIALINEEAEEFTWAVENGDLLEAIDALCDLLYVTYGAAVAFGVNLKPFFNTVHNNNMTKVGGPVSPTGKQLKPANYRQVNLRPILESQIRGDT